MIKLLVIDGSYLIHRSLKVPSLWELQNDSHERTGGIFGFLRSLSAEMRSIPTDYYPIVCWDKGLDPRRLAIYPEYKQHHLKVAESMTRNGASESEISHALEDKGIDNNTIESVISHIRESVNNHRPEVIKKYDPDDYVVQYHRQRDILIGLLNTMGVPSILVDGWEGDDLQALCTRISDKSVVMTDDRDLIQLISPSVMIFRPMAGELLKYDEYLKDNDYHSSRELVYIKAIVGDGSDNISSVTDGLDRKYRLGDTRAKFVAHVINDNNEDLDKYLPILSDLNKNYYKGFILNHNRFLRNMELVDLSLVKDDESVINYIKSELSDKVGKANLINTIRSLAALNITSFDVNGFISRVLSASSFMKNN